MPIILALFSNAYAYIIIILKNYANIIYLPLYRSHFKDKSTLFQQYNIIGAVLVQEGKLVARSSLSSSSFYCSARSLSVSTSCSSKV